MSDKRKLDEMYDGEGVQLISTYDMMCALSDYMYRFKGEDQMTVALTGLDDDNLTLSYEGEGWYAQWVDEFYRLDEIIAVYEDEPDMAVTVTAGYGEIAIATITR